MVKRAQKSDQRTNFLLPPNATATENAKYKLCKTIARYERENKLSEQELAEKLITDDLIKKILLPQLNGEDNIRADGRNYQYTFTLLFYTNKIKKPIN